MTDKLREATQLALDFILANGEHDQLCAVFGLDDDGLHMPCTCGLDKTLSALRAALAQQDTVDVHMCRETGGLSFGKRKECPYCTAAQQDAQAVPLEPCAVVKWQTGGPVIHITGEVQVGDLLYRAAPTPPAQRVMLTDEEIRDLWSWSMTAEAERTANTQQHAFAQGVIEAYERKNGIAQPCWCQACRPITINDMRMVLCPKCGNKRCPHANDHRNPCTGSNEPGQPGSAYQAK